MKKRILLAFFALLMLLLLTGCGSVSDMLSEVGSKMERDYAEAQGISGASNGDIDITTLVALRERATQLFTDGVPTATINDSAMAYKSGERVIITLNFTNNGKTGEYGFDFRLGKDGTYSLSRYGEGVRKEDL